MVVLRIPGRNFFKSLPSLHWCFGRPMSLITPFNIISSMSDSKLPLSTFLNEQSSYELPQMAARASGQFWRTSLPQRYIASPYEVALSMSISDYCCSCEIDHVKDRGWNRGWHRGSGRPSDTISTRTAYFLLGHSTYNIVPFLGTLYSSYLSVRIHVIERCIPYITPAAPCLPPRNGRDPC